MLDAARVVAVASESKMDVWSDQKTQDLEFPKRYTRSTAGVQEQIQIGGRESGEAGAGSTVCTPSGGKARQLWSHARTGLTLGSSPVLGHA
mmetsp:Transcript_40466/g.63167  ORF Transcript_40466/g.63167 Transcript_40466/m.63167 type:complete len:91 (+) Transcript_40466:334-606(+)